MTSDVKVDWFGNPLSVSGYGKHCRGITRPLSEKLDLKVIPTRGADSHLEEEVVETMESILSNKSRNIRTRIKQEREALEVWNLNPFSATATAYNIGSYSDPEQYTILYSVWEGEVIPNEWVSLTNGFSELWTPSPFSKKAFEKGGVNIPINIVPEGVDLSIYHPDYNPYVIYEDEFVFLSIFDFTYRKGWDVLLEAFCNEFKRDEDVRLLLKTYSGAHPKEEIVKIIEKAQSVYNYSPKISLINTFLDSKEMPELYNSADAFILCSRGEGWGLPLYEASACGLPVITTNYSAPTDYLEDVYWIDIDSLEPYPFAETIGHEPNCTGIEFGEPSVESTQEQMRTIFEEDNPKVPDVSEFTWENASKKASKLLKERWDEWK